MKRNVGQSVFPHTQTKVFSVVCTKHTVTVHGRLVRSESYLIQDYMRFVGKTAARADIFLHDSRYRKSVCRYSVQCH